MSKGYQQINESDIPGDLRWDTPRANQGQTVEHSYAKPGSAGEAGDGDPYYRIIDRSTGGATYYRWED